MNGETHDGTHRIHRMAEKRECDNHSIISAVGGMTSTIVRARLLHNI